MAALSNQHDTGKKSDLLMAGITIIVVVLKLIIMLMMIMTVMMMFVEMVVMLIAVVMMVKNMMMKITLALAIMVSVYDQGNNGNVNGMMVVLSMMEIM